MSRFFHLTPSKHFRFSFHFLKGVHELIMFFVAKSTSGVHLRGPLLDGFPKFGPHACINHQFLAVLPTARYTIQRLNFSIAIDGSNHRGLPWRHIAYLCQLYAAHIRLSNHYFASFSAACAAANRAIGTRNGEQLT